jgi:hypothetical protein
MAIEVSVPGTADLQPHHLLLDINGTLTPRAADLGVQPGAVLLGLLVAAIALGGILTVAHSAQEGAQVSPVLASPTR